MSKPDINKASYYERESEEVKVVGRE